MFNANAFVSFLDFEAHFKEIHRKNSRTDRPFFVHVTSVVVSNAPIHPDGVDGRRAHFLITGHQGNHRNIKRGGR